ncbi:hypothetical protein [Levilactobacillus parabrevis]|uniref:hypothetical protein n=1 Tax=Levilactobacillus parabrevis TaxID=357278 RepID=UPI0021A5694D|nr:hypothetical protein [Levilactobacillus parabrevis]MCT4486387.1 hypothetical protein [Levilactobacillus parabrevis]MCT4489045.1 hypothetical protein [Levilactobacillus parabrevis]
MNDQPFSTNMLTLEVLDAICDRLGIRPSALIFLDHDFSSDEITALETYLTQRSLGHVKTTMSNLTAQLLTIKTFTPEAAQTIARELCTAWLQEDRYTQTLTLA